MVFARTTARGVHNAVKRNERGIDQITHVLFSSLPGDEAARQIDKRTVVPRLRAAAEYPRPC
ncbi:hypothetical protein GCM10009556_046200 [Acrocarpospora pleiomorpha]